MIRQTDTEKTTQRRIRPAPVGITIASGDT
jgi:hypothetical protein